MGIFTYFIYKQLARDGDADNNRQKEKNLEIYPFRMDLKKIDKNIVYNIKCLR